MTAVSDAFRYDPYGGLISGAVTSTTPSPWRYQGRLLENAGAGTSELYDFGFRSYSPGLGAFTSIDNLTGSAQNPLTLNRFLYANASPETLIDPDGHLSIMEDGLIIREQQSYRQLVKRVKHGTRTRSDVLKAARVRAVGPRNRGLFSEFDRRWERGPAKKSGAPGAAVRLKRAESVPAGDSWSQAVDQQRSDVARRQREAEMGPPECGNGFACAAFLFSGVAVASAGAAAFGGFAYDGAVAVASAGTTGLTWLWDKVTGGGSRAPVPAAPSTQLATPGGLRANDALDVQLAARGIPTASTFLNRTMAESSLGDVLSANAREIASWASSASGGANRAFAATFDNVVGRILYQGAPTSVYGNTAIAVLRASATSPNGFHILTGYVAE